MFHLHVNMNYWEYEGGSPKKKYTSKVMGDWYMLYRRHVRIYLCFGPSQDF